MGAWARKDVYKITEWRDDSVYKTKRLGSIWLAYRKDRTRTPAEENEIAHQYGGDQLVNTMDSHYGPEIPWEGMK